MKKNYFIGILLLFLTSISIVAQEQAPIQNFSSKEYNGENQNWSISQGLDNYIYVANNSGLLEFNGANWRLYPSPNNSVLRSVNVIGNKIYTGCFREFGYWERNEYGGLEYNSLIGKLGGINIQDQNIWNIIGFKDWVLFQSLQNIFIYNSTTDSINIINSKTKLTKIFKVDESIYFQKIEDGLYKFENGVPILVNNNPILQQNEIVTIFLKENRILVQTQKNGFFFLQENNNLSKWKIPADNLISKASTYSSMQLKDGSYILGTISNGIYHLDNNGAVISSINQKKGLNNNTVLSIHEDTDSNLWLGLDNGISVVNIQSPIHVFNDINGALGSVYTSLIFDDKLYLGSNQGLYVRNNNSTDDFSFIEGTKGQVWCLKVFDGTLFCGHNNGTYVINNNEATLISDIKGTWDIQSIPNKNDWLMQGHYGGLSILHKKNNNWQLKNHIQGYENSCRYFNTLNSNEVFVNNEFRGVFKLNLNQSYTAVKNALKVESVNAGLKSSLIQYNGDLIYTSEEGIFKYNNSLKKFEKDSVFTKSFFGADNYISGRLVLNEKDNSLWGFTDRNITLLSPGGLNQKLTPLQFSLPSSSRNFIVAFENSLNLSEKKYLFGTSNGYLILDLNKDRNKDYTIQINSIEKSILNKAKTSVPLNIEPYFSNNDNNVFFQYSAPVYDKYNEVNYKYQLIGIYDEWSDWSTLSEISFKNLPYGKYTFNVKALIGNKESINIESYKFTIEKPFFLSTIMIYVYIFLLLILSVIIHRVYRYYYTLKQRKVLVRSQRKLHVEKLESEKQLMKSRNDNLRQAIENKNSELAISTMSLIKKNEFLSDIKKELENVKNSNNIKPVIGIINKNLNNTDDWNLFKKAFDNADKDFFNKIKGIHPSLSPNDLKLCAYLRLNLSSKEIAPLLNISTRSVEIKRYRLRKKMDLPHESNLVQYILDI